MLKRTFGARFFELVSGVGVTVFRKASARDRRGLAVLLSVSSTPPEALVEQRTAPKKYVVFCTGCGQFTSKSGAFVRSGKL